MSVIEELKSTEVTATAKTISNYLQLIRDTASGKSVKGPVAAEVLKAANKSVAELEAEVERVKRRPVLQALLKQHGVLHSELSAIPAKFDAIELAFNEIKKTQYEQPRDRLSERSEELNRKLEEIETARGELMSSSKDESILSRDQAKLAEISKAVSRIKYLETNGASGKSFGSVAELSEARNLAQRLTSEREVILAEKVHASY